MRITVILRDTGMRGGGTLTEPELKFSTKFADPDTGVAIDLKFLIKVK